MGTRVVLREDGCREGYSGRVSAEVTEVNQERLHERASNNRQRVAKRFKGLSCALVGE